jgi:hypothetical protein
MLLKAKLTKRNRNGNASESKQARISELNEYLCDWLNDLNPTLHYNPPMHPAVYVLQ